MACTARQDHCLLAKCAGDLLTEKRERLFLARSMWNHVIFCVRPHNRYLFIYIISWQLYNTLAGLYALVLATPHAFTLRSLAIVRHAVHFLDNDHI